LDLFRIHGPVRDPRVILLVDRGPGASNGQPNFLSLMG
jgi:hypothetical protein